MKIRNLKPKSVFVYNGVPLIVRRVERLGTDTVRLHVRLDGHDGSVRVDGTRCVNWYADPVRLPPRRRARKKPKPISGCY